MTLPLQDIERLFTESCKDRNFASFEVRPLLSQLIGVMKENEILRAHQGTTENMLSEFAHRIERRRSATKETP